MFFPRSHSTRNRVVVMVVVLFVTTIIGNFTLQHDPRIGRLLDSYQGVGVYDNGVLFWKAYGKHYSEDGYYYGQKWQCVEFVKRFYFEAKQHRMPDVFG